MISALLFYYFLLSSVDGFMRNTLQNSYVHHNYRIYSDSIQKESLTSAEVIELYKEELLSKRGTPEIVDRLENLAMKHPGLEVDLNLYRALYSFPLDTFQEDGIMRMIEGNNVIVTTPTGSGKTVVAELAIYFALMMGLRVAYTTPLKALSNQKFADFKARYGGDRVGLLTGDIAINRGAPITVMTTEVFRNMVYDAGSESQLSNLFAVIFDEFHYMNDPDRGTVWEESVISCPSHIRILALSATMGNVDDIQGWISSIHGPTELVSSTHRPVPLRYLFAMKQGLLPLFRDPNAGPGALRGVSLLPGGKVPGYCVVNPSIVKLEEQAGKIAQSKATKSGRPLKTIKPNANTVLPRYDDIVADLKKADLLPAIVFVFSRTGCEQYAKLITGMRTKLLTDDDVRYIGLAITNFAKTNPEIPISKQLVMMLKSGVAVHHAGLIPVWKGFVEELFNANKIKVLFATETLAAGVNMPARTTVISSVTKRVNSEIVKLKTSQLLQMAGRAGRRGKDVEGTVVLMRSRFEDVNLGHRILVSPVDGIRSHFKMSYGLTVKLLETRSVEDCKRLIERGFGSYIFTRKASRKEVEEVSEVSEEEIFREVLQRYGLPEARNFVKTARRLEKERSTLDYLMQKIRETEDDLVHAIAEYMPLGIGLYLRGGGSGEEASGSGLDGFFLGDVDWADGRGRGRRTRGYGVITRDLRVLVVQKEHIKSFLDDDVSLPPRAASALLQALDHVDVWDEVELPGGRKPIIEGRLQIDVATGVSTSVSVVDPNELNELRYAIQTVRESPVAPVKDVPGAVIRQQNIVKELEVELAETQVAKAGDEMLVIDALRYAASQKDPMAFVMGDGPGQRGSQSNDRKPKEAFAWRMFQNVLKVLRDFGAMQQEETRSTELGQMVGSLSADNELWLGLVLQHPNIVSLKPAELAAVVSSVVVDGYKASNAYIKYRPSEPVQNMLRELAGLAERLRTAQAAARIDFPVHLTAESGGLVESWVGGVTWRELCSGTSLDQGDLCRLLRRTTEVLMQIPQAIGVPLSVSQTAYEAATLMDRFPVADETLSADKRSFAVSSGSGVGFEVVGENVGIDQSSLSTDSEIDGISSLNTQVDVESYGGTSSSSGVAGSGALADLAVLDEIFASVLRGGDDDEDQSRGRVFTPKPKPKPSAIERDGARDNKMKANQGRSGSSGRGFSPVSPVDEEEVISYFGDDDDLRDEDDDVSDEDDSLFTMEEEEEDYEELVGDDEAQLFVEDLLDD